MSDRAEILRQIRDRADAQLAEDAVAGRVKLDRDGLAALAWWTWRDGLYNAPGMSTEAEHNRWLAVVANVLAAAGHSDYPPGVRWTCPRCGNQAIVVGDLAHVRCTCGHVSATPTPVSTPVDGKLGGQRQGGHETAREARDLVRPKAGTQRAQVLDELEHLRKHFPEKHGLTDVELAKITGLPANSVRPRRVELVDAGFVHDTGHRRVHNGRRHVVWGLVDLDPQGTLL